MAFDPTSATLIDEEPRQGFDPSSATLVEEPAKPAYVPPELQQFDEQQAMERQAGATATLGGVKDVFSQAAKLPVKSALIASGAGALRWPTDKELETPVVSPEAMKTVMPYAYAADAAARVFPQNPVAQVAQGATDALTNVASGLTSPENAAMLGVAPESAIGQRLVAGTFLGQSLMGLPEQWDALEKDPTLRGKTKIAGEMIAGTALPALGLKGHAKVGEVTKESLGQTPRTTPEAHPGEVLRDPLPPKTESSPPLSPEPSIPPDSEGHPSENLTTPQAEPSTAEIQGEAPSVPNATENQPAPLIPKTDSGIKEPVSEPVVPTGQNTPELNPTSTKNAVTEAERKSRGIAPAAETARREFGTVWDEAEAIHKADPTAPERLASEVAANPRALSDRENALLLRRQIEVQNEHDAAVKAVNEAKDQATKIDASARLERARDDLQVVYDATKAAGTETGRGLNARKMLANDDFSLAKMEATTRAVVNNGKALSEKQLSEVKGLHERIKSAEERLAAYEARDQFETELKKAKAESKKAGFKPQSFLEQQAQRARERIVARRGKLFADPVGVTQIAHLADEAIIGASHIAKGITKFADWSAQMIAEFGERIKPHLQALYAKARELHNKASSGGKDVTPEERAATVNKARETSLQNQIQALEQQIKTGEAINTVKPKVGYPEAIAELRRKRDALKAKLNPPKVPPTRLDIAKKLTTAKTKQIEAFLKEGKELPKRPDPIRPDRELLELRGALQRAKDSYQARLDEGRRANMTLPQRASEIFVRAERAMKLTGITTLGKLYGAGFTRLITTPIEEGVGAILSKSPILRRIASEAPREGGMSLRAEGRSLTSGIARGVRNIPRILKGERTNEEAIYGKHSGYERKSWLDAPGRVHGAIKSAFKEAERERATIKRQQFVQRKGIDPTEAATEQEIGQAAHMDAQRAIFMQDNVLSDIFRGGVRMLENSKKFPTAGFYMAKLANFLLPIVKVPTNVALETATHITGIGTGTGKLIQVMSRGIKTIRPAEADMIMRHYKKGAIGAALFLTGYFNADKFGGFYQKGDKRDPKDVRWGGARIAGVNIPAWLLHAPAFIVLQAGATARRMQNRPTHGGPKAAALSVAEGLAHEIPFVNEMGRMDKILADGWEGVKARGTLLSGSIVPQAVRNVSDWLEDKDAFGNKVRRSPKSEWDYVKMAVPGLRNTVPLHEAMKQRKLDQIRGTLLRR